MKKKVIRLEVESSVILRSARASRKFDNITQQIIQKERSRPINEIRNKRDKLWSLLANQVIGSAMK